MSTEELAGYLRQGLRQAEAFEMDCDRCGIVRVIAIDRPDVCPICGVQRDVWKRTAIILTNRPLPQVAVVRAPIWRLLSRIAPGLAELRARGDRGYAAGLEGRYSVHQPQRHVSG